MTRNAFAIIVIGLLCLLGYSNTFANGFLLDDYLFLFNDKGLSSVTLGQLFQEGINGVYRPVGLGLFKYELDFFGDNPFGYHVVNLILLFAMGLSCFAILRHISRNYHWALLAASLYTIHPINSFLVNYKSASGLSLFILFMQLSVLMYLQFDQNKRLPKLLLSYLFYFLALMCHEISFMTPVYIALILFMLKGVSFFNSIKRVLGFFVVFCLYFMMRTQALGLFHVQTPESLNISFFQYITTYLHMLYWYFSKLIVPVDILYVWFEPIATVVYPVWNVLFLLILSDICLCFIFYARKSVKALSLVKFVFGLLTLPLICFINVHSLKAAMIEPHWMNFPSMGFYGLVAFGLMSLKKIMPVRLWLFLIGGLLVGMTALTYNTNKVWADATTYCTYWKEKNPTNGSPTYCLHNTYIRENSRGLDKTQYKNCTQAAQLGVRYNNIRQKHNAKQFYRMALDMDPKCKLALLGLGVLYQEQAQYDLAEKFFKLAIQHHPRDGAGQAYLKTLHESRGRLGL